MAAVAVCIGITKYYSLDMDSQEGSSLPAVVALAEGEIAEINAELTPLRKEYRDLKKRVDGMVIFRDRTIVTENRTRTKARSNVEFHASPEEEMFFEHRRRYEEADVELRKFNEDIDIVKMSQDPEDKKDRNLLMKFRYALERTVAEQLEHMRKILSDIRARLEDVETKMIGMKQHREQLTNQMIQHRDKMEVAREGGKEPTSEELVAKMAAKHGVSVEEVQELLNAKSVHVDP